MFLHRNPFDDEIALRRYVQGNPLLETNEGTFRDSVIYTLRAWLRVLIGDLIIIFVPACREPSPEVFVPVGMGNIADPFPKTRVKRLACSAVVGKRVREGDLGLSSIS